MFAISNIQKQDQKFFSGGTKSDGQFSAVPQRWLDPARLLRRGLGNDFLQNIADNGPAVGIQHALTGGPKIQRTCGGSSDNCGEKEDESKGIQTKLTISQPGDRYEQEAERVAEQVLQLSDSPFHAENELPRTGMNIQRLSTQSDTTTESPLNLQLNENGGQPLSPKTRQYMEPRFGLDFDHVRLHSDDDAHRMTSQIQARAFTYGNHIWLGKSESEQDRRLMAHELTHVVQQRQPSAYHQVQRQLYPPIPIVVRSPTATSVVVNAVDARQEPDAPWYFPPRYTGPLTWLFRGDVRMTDISSMVTNVIAFLNGRRMNRLNVMDHGNETGVEIGDNWLSSPADVARFAGILGRLSPHFDSSAIVHMQNCHAGQNRGVICALAATFGVPVYAGTGLHNPLYGVNFGDYVRCEPNGTFNPNVGRPSTPVAPNPTDMNPIA